MMLMSSAPVCLRVVGLHATRSCMENN